MRIQAPILRAGLIAVATAFFGDPAEAQTALVAVTHSDPDGLVSAGETVRIQVIHTRSNAPILAGIGGSLVTTGDLGEASNLFTQLIPNPPEIGYVNSIGTPIGGSVHGVSHEFLSHPLFVMWIHPAYITSTGVEVLSFDWTAPAVAAPTAIDFNWTPSTQLPAVRAILPPYGQIIIEFIPTTYTGASLVVLPAPSTLVMLAALCAAGNARRRR
jgi:hypothetical protein